MKRFYDYDFSVLIYLLFILFISYHYRIYFSSEPIGSGDLPFHINLSEFYKNYFYKGLFSIYNPTTLTGTPTIHFYPFLAYLVSIIISYPLDLFYDESIRLSIHLTLVFCISLIPISLNYAVSPFLDDLFANFDKKTLCNQKNQLNIVRALLICTISYWFIDSDHIGIGIGAPAALYVGLYAQLFGWHILIIYIGLLSRIIINNNNNFLLISLIISFSILTHLLTTIFIIFIALLSILWFREIRLRLLKSHIVGIILTGFWFIPFISFMSNFTVSETLIGGDILTTLLKYPIYILIYIKNLLIDKQFSIDATYLLFSLIIFIAFTSKEIRKSRLISSFYFFGMIALIVFSSSFIQLNIPIGLHYARINGYIIILFLILFIATPFSWFIKIYSIKNILYQKALFLFVVAIILSCFISNWIKPNKYEYRINNTHGYKNFANQKKVIDYFNSIDKKGRVYVEYLLNFPPYASVHHLPSLIFKNSGFEQVVNSEYHSSIAYRLITFSLLKLGTNPYRSDFIDKSDINTSLSTAFNQLKDFGITHLVIGTDNFLMNSIKYSNFEPVKIGTYNILKIQNNLRKVEIPKKYLIGYHDLKNNLPFELIQYYFYTNNDLTTFYDLILLENLKDIPEDINKIIINTDKSEIDTNDNVNISNKFILINYENQFFDKSGNFPKKIKQTKYKNIVKYLSKTNLVKSLDHLNKISTAPKTNNIPEIIPILEWSSDFQSFNLKNLIPNKIYRINYSYFPYWYTKDGIIFRGSGERMFLLANKNEAHFTYTRIYSTSTWVGWILTLIALIFLGMSYVNNNKK